MTQSSIKKLHHDMTSIERNSCRYILPNQYYIVNVTIPSFSDTEKVKALLFDQHAPIAIYQSIDRVLLVFSCVEDDKEHELQGDTYLIVSKFTCFFANDTNMLTCKVLDMPSVSAKPSRLDISTRIVCFTTKNEILTYLMWIMYQTTQNAMIHLSGGKLTTKDLQFNTDSENKQLLEKCGIKWDKCEDFVKYGMILKLKRKKTDKETGVTVTKMCEPFDAREIKKFSHFLFD